MNKELEILDNGNQLRSGLKTFQLVLFIFACLGFVVKLLYSLYWYGQLSRISAFNDYGFDKMIRTFKLAAIGLFVHAILLFAGSLLLFLRRKAGAWFYLSAQLLFFFTILFFINLQNKSFDFKRMSVIELLVFAACLLIPAVFILMNFINRRYWLNRKRS